MFSEIVKYLNIAFKRLGMNLEARLHMGGHDPSLAQGIYFHRRAANLFSTVPASELETMITQNKDKLDYGTVETVLSYSETNDKLINKGAKYISLQRCEEVRKLLGTKE